MSYSCHECFTDCNNPDHKDRKFPYYIGEYYSYPLGRKKFKLVDVDSWIFIFECGHRVTDCVFIDLIRVKTGIQVYQDGQTEMEFN